MMNWLCILNRENFEIVKEKLVWGVTERHKRMLNMAKPGDLCAFYLIGEGYKKEPAIAGIFEVVSIPYKDDTSIFTSKKSEKEIYQYRVQLKSLHDFRKELLFKPLIPSLDFITNKKYYSGHVIGKAMRTISAKDMDLIIERGTNEY